MSDIFGIGGVIGGLLGYKGTKDTNKANREIADQATAFNAQEAAANRSFQAEQSATAYQRAVADMSAAGLNPMLAYQQGGASTPSGATAQAVTTKMDNPLKGLGEGVSSAMQLAQVATGLENTKSQTGLNDAMAQKASADTLATMNSAEGSRFEIDFMQGIRRDILEQQKQGGIYEMFGKRRDATRAANESDAMNEGPPGFTEGRKAAEAGLQRQIAETFLTQADVPRARAERDFYEGGGKFMPYLNALGEIFSSAGGLKRLFRPGR